MQQSKYLNSLRLLSDKWGVAYYLEFHFSTHTSDVNNWEPNEIFTGGDRTYRLVKLKAIIQPQDFDDPSPAIFILKPSED